MRLLLTVANAEPERGFSENKNLLDGRTKLDELTIESLRLVKHEINLHNNLPTLLPITKEMISYFNSSFKNFNESEQAKKDLEKKHAEQEKEKEKRKKLDQREEIEKNLSELGKQLRLSKNMINEGQALMNTASSGTINQALLIRAKAFLNTGLNEANELEKKIFSEEKKLENLSTEH